MPHKTYNLPLGCQICVLKVITGGELGKSCGKTRLALKNPPSYSVSGGPTMNNSQLKIFSSSPKPTDTPSGGFLDNSVTYRAFLRNELIHEGEKTFYPNIVVAKVLVHKLILTYFSIYSNV
jgi:hypothetical protein